MLRTFSFLPNPIRLIVMLTLLSGAYQSSQAQSERRFAVQFNATANNGDVNYGGNFIREYLPVKDYNGVSSGGGTGWGFDLGIGITVPVARRTTVIGNIGYSQFGYKVQGEVTDFDPPDMRPLDPSIPQRADGRIHYDFVALQAGVAYTFNDDPAEGFFMALLVDYLIHTATGWKLDVVYEGEGTGVVDDPDLINDDDLNNLFLLGFNAGYKIPVTERISVVPKATFKFGLNPIVDDILKPTVFEFGASVMYWF